MKEFVIKAGKFFLDFSMWISFTFAGLILLGGLFSGEFSGFLASIIVAIFIVFATIVANFFLYILIDIRDNLVASKKEN